ncbi:hypothetical protein KUL42_10170 [Alteromonas sp. KUL42]|uniref:hypothetical protein n=1 Tax=Alteromonas sp. KUL42 TaxID=2480797 RepID=UPI0010367689|nr:hypothetical protein [Alteromonas sp. KUL42]TAP37803.1 hypothetical protein EYR97_05040 [Alteromonas sp. KUL42]GEA06256.1 hypothetical protein KUL42_10170 [Alteromonas sp. KUL42]
MEDEYQNKYDNQSMVPDGLKFVAFLMLFMCLVFAFVFLPEYERGQERELIHYIFSLSYMLTGLFLSSIIFGIAFICECLDKSVRKDSSQTNQETASTTK